MRTIREVMDLSVLSLDMPVRCNNCMARLNVQTLCELTALSKAQVANVRNVGKKSIEEIESRLNEMGLWWGMSDRDWLTWGLSRIEWIKSH